MSILIKGMEMPTSCCACFCARGNECGITRYKPTFEEWYEDGVKECPLVPVPPHGRLIDADALIKELTLDDEDGNSGASLLMAIFLEVLKAAPTIIPAEEGE